MQISDFFWGSVNLPPPRDKEVSDACRQNISDRQNDPNKRAYQNVPFTLRGSAKKKQRCTTNFEIQSNKQIVVFVLFPLILPAKGTTGKGGEFEEESRVKHKVDPTEEHGVRLNVCVHAYVYAFNLLHLADDSDTVNAETEQEGQNVKSVHHFHQQQKIKSIRNDSGKKANMD